MKKKKINLNKFIALILSFLFIMQQSLAYQVLAQSTITNGDGSVIGPNGGENIWNIKPDAVNGDTGFKQFGKIDLGQGDILNFIYNYVMQSQSGTGNDLTLEDKHGTIDTFVALVNEGVNINGIVNALQNVNGNLKNDGNLLFISPGGMVVGASGVLNVGNLSVISPTPSSYETLKTSLNLPQTQQYYINDYDVSYDESDPEGTSVIVPTSYDYTKSTAIYTDKTLDTSSLSYGADSGAITINGAVIARGNVDLQGGNVAIGNGGLLVAGVGGNTEVLTSHDAAKTLFDSLVATDNMTSGNAFASSNGKITITSKTGTSVADGGIVRNYGTGNTTITNTGVSGVNIAGEVSNAKGNLTVTNSAGDLLVNTTGLVRNNGTMTFTNNGSGTKLALNGTVKNDGDLLVTNETGTNGLLVGGNVTNNTGSATFTNKAGLLNVTNGGTITSNGTSLTMQNTTGTGMTISGTVNNNAGSATFTNNKGKLLVDSTGIINSKGSNLLVYNDGTSGMDIQGKVNINHANKTNTVQFTNKNSNMTLGHTSNKDNISSNADVNIDITNGNLLNNGVTHNLIATTNGANLNLDVTNGAIGEEVGPNDGVYTGIGTNARDLSKSVNVSIDGKIKATSTQGTNKSVINLASLDKNMNVDQIKADGRVILLADDSTNKGETPYDIINASSDPSKPNVEGAGISIIASGNIGEDGNALTFRQNNGSYGSVDGQLNHTDDAQYGVDMLAIKDINVKGMDAANGDKLETNVGGLISREGSINAEFSGDTFIRETTAANEINITTRGKNMYIENLGEVPTYPQDYYGPNENIHPDKVKITALDLGTSWDNPDDHSNAADSTIIIKNGKIEGQGQGRPAHEQDLTLVADNAYAGGYHFHMGKDRGVKSDDPLRFNLSYVEEDARTNKITTPEGETVSIRAKAVRPDDVTAIGQDEADRNYYYGGSSQGGDEGYDGVKDDDGNYVDNPNGDEQGDENDDDNLVVPKDDEEVVDTDADSDTDIDTDTDTDTDIDTDTDTDTDTDVDTDTDTDTDIDTDTDVDTDSDSDIDTDSDTDTDIDTDTDTDTDLDTDTDTDTDTDVDTDTDIDTDIDTDTDVDTDTDTDTDTDIDEPDLPSIDLGQAVYKQRVVSDRVDSIDKRQYMRFGGEEAQDLITFESTDDVIAISDISRGGVSLKHNKKLKVGDVVPVHLTYGDLEINANVKIVSASDVKAGGQFIDLDQATANKLLYLSLLEKDQPIAQTIQNSNITTTIEE